MEPEDVPNLTQATYNACKTMYNKIEVTEVFISFAL